MNLVGTPGQRWGSELPLWGPLGSPMHTTSKKLAKREKRARFPTSEWEKYFGVASGSGLDNNGHNEECRQLTVVSLQSQNYLACMSRIIGKLGNNAAVVEMYITPRYDHLSLPWGTTISATTISATRKLHVTPGQVYITSMCTSLVYNNTSSEMWTIWNAHAALVIWLKSKQVSVRVKRQAWRCWWWCWLRWWWWLW